VFNGKLSVVELIKIDVVPVIATSEFSVEKLPFHGLWGGRLRMGIS